MLNLFGWEVGMNWGEALVLIAGALVIAAILQVIGRVGFGTEWIFTGVAALVGGWLGSEAFGSLSTWGPVMDGLYLVPALIGAVILGGVVDAFLRYGTGGTYLPAPRPV
ncbi:MAG TPA: GlsB/YeaQ/YmgE family stress response membrane protein [Candidatus Limnocylindria bacterium]|jgi:hypothetical protein